MKRFLLLLCLCSLFLFCFQLNSYAVVDINEIDSNVYKLYQKNVISLDLYNAYMNANNLHSGNIYSTRNNLISGCNATNAIGYSILILDYNGYSSSGTGLGTPNLVVLIAKGTIGNASNSSSNDLYYNWNNLVRTCTYKWNGTNANYSSSNSAFYGNKGTPTWGYTTININTRTFQLNGGEEFGGYYITEEPLELPIFSLISHNGTKALYQDNRLIGNFERFNYNVNGWTAIGLISNYRNCEKLNVMLHAYTSDAISQIIGIASYETNKGFNNNNFIKLDRYGSTAQVLVNNVYLNQGYNVFCNCYVDDTYHALEDYNVVFTTANDTTTSGDLVNDDIYNNNDVAVINVIHDLTDYSSGDIWNSLGYGFNIFSGDLSGDFFSGDIFDKVGFNDYTKNRYNLFVYQIYKGILNSLHSSNADESLSFTLHGHVYTIYASQFTIPDSPLKSFIRLFVIARYNYFVFTTIL